MATLLEAEADRRDAPAPAAEPAAPRRVNEPPTVGLRERTIGWVRHRRLSLAVLAVVLVIVGALNAWNLHGWPARVNDDEGTYVAQAWAMVARGEIAHYTYWYDHPFLGWAMIAAYAWVTNGFDRAPSGIMVGREFMLITIVVTCAWLFLLARRLKFSRAAVAATVLLFGLSPLAIYFHRMVFLDNLATMWMIGALAAAASRRRSVAAAFWSAVCMAAAVLTKETIAILLPALVWMLLQHTDKRTRAWNVGVFFTTFAVIVASYPTLALLKNELLPGEGHVSLGWAVWWQLFGRSGSGGLFDTSGTTFALAKSWVDIDAWLLLGGAALVPLGFVSRRLRPIALALLIQILMMMRGGYMPFAYVIALLPFAALLIGGILDTLGRPILPARRAPTADGGTGSGRLRVVLGRAGWVPLAAAVTAFAVLGAPAWVRAIDRQSTVDGSANSRAATQWVISNVDRNAVVVTDDYIWLDLTLAHFANPVWLWKLDTDPQVMAQQLPDGYLSIDYIVMAGQAESTLGSLPTLKTGIAHSELVTRFGEVEIRRVVPPTPS
jgi:hypothetical protein